VNPAAGAGWQSGGGPATEPERTLSRFGRFRMFARPRFRTATHAVPVMRGSSGRPLFVTAAGMPSADAADLVRRMAGRYRLPDALRRADTLARTGRPNHPPATMTDRQHDCSSGSFLAAARVFLPCGRNQAGAPAAAQRRGRTSLIPASGGRSSRLRKVRLRLAYQGSRACSRCA
jgi:hypothetical protein